MTENNSPKILIVDDLPANLVALAKVLRRVDASVLRANSGNEALSLMLRNEFAVVLLDVQMPDVDGFETATLMRENDATRHVPIIFVTAISKGDEHVFRGYEAGAVDYLFKPIDSDILISKVNVFLDLYGHRKRATDAIARLEREVSEHRRAEEELQRHRDHLEELVNARMGELRTIVNAMSGRELRMVELKETIRRLRGQLEAAGLTPDADDPLQAHTAADALTPGETAAVAEDDAMEGLRGGE